MDAASPACRSARPPDHAVSRRIAGGAGDAGEVAVVAGRRSIETLAGQTGARRMRRLFFLLFTLTSGSRSRHHQRMQLTWPEIVESIRGKRSTDAKNLFASAFGGVEELASFIAAGPLNSVLFGWTSMFDLCIQQVDVEPYSGPYLRVSPLHSGRIEFRYVDTAIAQRQWHRETTPDAVVPRLIHFMDQLGWSTEPVRR